VDPRDSKSDNMIGISTSVSGSELENVYKYTIVLAGEVSLKMKANCIVLLVLIGLHPNK
jgi:hypothetical protein